MRDTVAMQVRCLSASIVGACRSMHDEDVVMDCGIDENDSQRKALLVHRMLCYV
jgi:hypothetical protein